LDQQQANAAIQFFTCDLDNLGTLFTKGLWSAPLVPIDDGKNVAICFSALSIGSAIRRVESWLDRGGLSDHLTNARRGEKYEAWVRQPINEELSANKHLPHSKCALDSIARTDQNGEQIDLLISLGNLAIVGEVKCRLYPIESAEHYNYLERLNDAGDQVVRKANWLKQNPEAIAKALHLPTATVQTLRIVPIVVMNQGAGFGLLANGARVVDFSFLRLYLSDNEYLSGMAFDAERRLSVPTYEKLYRDEMDAASRFEQTMANPPPLKNVIASAVWQDNKFPMADGHDFYVANCYPGEPSKEATQLASMLASANRSKKKLRLSRTAHVK
jgi:hypothetical protein